MRSAMCTPGLLASTIPVASGSDHDMHFLTSGARAEEKRGLRCALQSYGSSEASSERSDHVAAVNVATVVAGAFHAAEAGVRPTVVSCRGDNAGRARCRRNPRKRCTSPCPAAGDDIGSETVTAAPEVQCGDAVFFEQQAARHRRRKDASRDASAHKTSFYIPAHGPPDHERSGRGQDLNIRPGLRGTAQPRRSSPWSSTSSSGL